MSTQHPGFHGYERYERAKAHFAREEYAQVVQELEALFTDLAEARSEVGQSHVPGEDPVGHGTAEVHLLLARAYFQTAQLRRAEAAAREVLREAPDDAYAHLLLGRTLQRAGRHDEARGPLRLAELLGGYGSGPSDP